MKEDLRVSLVQTDLAWQDASANRQLLAEKLQALAGKADLIVLPEMFTSAFVTGEGAVAEDYPGPTLDWMLQQASSLNAAVTGSIAVRENGKRYNRLLFVTADGKVSHYDKRHLFRMLNEDKRYSAGSDKLLVELHGWRILPMVCYDLRFPVWSRYTDSEPYDLLLVVANWPAPRSSHWQILLQARAVENLCYVAGVNRVGTDGNGLQYDGHSCLVDFQGRQLLSAGSQENTITGTLSAKALKDWRADFPAWMDADDFTLN